MEVIIFVCIILKTIQYRYIKGKLKRFAVLGISKSKTKVGGIAH